MGKTLISSGVPIPPEDSGVVIPQPTGGKTLISSGVPTPPEDSGVVIPQPTGGKTLLSTIRGKDGDPGEDAYQIAVENGFEGTEIEWLESLDGVDGHDAYSIALLEGFIGTRAEWLESLRGKSAYDLAVLNGFTGTADEWLDFLQGEDGKSAYLLAVNDGFEGNVELWLDSLEGLDGDDGYTPYLSLSATHLQVTYVHDEDEQGPTNLLALSSITGPPGKSAYQSAVSAGFVGTENEWVASLKGKSAVFPPTQGSATTVAYGQPAELTTTLDPETGLLLFNAKIPAGKDGVSLAQPVPTVVIRDAADGAPGSGTVTGTYPNWNFEFFLRRGLQGTPGAQGASGMPNVDLVGEGMPNGHLTASAGTIYRDTLVTTVGSGASSRILLGTNGASIWLKTTASGNTGWVVLRGDTGWRDIRPLLTVTTGMSYSVGKLRRINDLISVNVGWMTVPNSSSITYGQQIWTMASGFTPEIDDATTLSGDGNSGGQFFIRNQTELRVKTASSTWVRGTLLVPTAQAWPTGILPGGHTT